MASRDNIFGVLSERAPDEPDVSGGDDDQRSATNINADQAVVAGTLRAPWKWESLLVESAVIGGSDRWARRLNGLAAEYELKIRELTSEQTDRRAFSAWSASGRTLHTSENSRCRSSKRCPPGQSRPCGVIGFSASKI